ncbi:MAG: TetR family transcriptional regulator [Lachnospiraceae bacterium]|nr:TetR family transcriptional regulator [Lachnospiraceae bacterium]
MSAKETKERILKCTTELILERGGDISNVTIRTIAARAGIGVGLTNHYFSSKEQLIEECIESVFSELFEMLAGNGIVTTAGIDKANNADGKLKVGSELSDDIGNEQKAGFSGVDRNGQKAETEGSDGSEPKAGELADEKDDLLAGLLDPDPEDENDLALSLQETLTAGDDELTAGLAGTDILTENSLSSGILEDDEHGGDEATHRAADLVMNFLIKNEAIAKAALVRDAQNPLAKDYTAKLTDAFAYAMVDHRKFEEIENNDRMTERMKEQFREHIVSEQKLKAFMIMSSIKEALIRREVLKENMQIDLLDEEQRKEYVDSLLEMLY